MDGAPTSDRELQSAAIYWQAAHFFGWTPTMTDAVPNVVLEHMLTFAQRYEKKKAEAMNPDG